MGETAIEDYRIRRCQRVNLFMIPNHKLKRLFNTAGKKNYRLTYNKRVIEAPSYNNKVYGNENIMVMMKESTTPQVDLSVIDKVPGEDYADVESLITEQKHLQD